MKDIRGLPQPGLNEEWREWADRLIQALERGGAGVEVGQIGEFVNLPPGWLPADGSTFRKENFPNLYRVLGSTTVPSLLPQYSPTNVVGIKA